ncbi:four helix bundle protein [Methylobacterium sp. E-016]|uniref:four helix bundle protein n=1 Tax=Methylobacterium sp. E-016 TaxID=2836556 RepID=UPI001FBB4816|nr:four helix bundle protein [Methylobacterium sp. E-016]
MTLAEACYGETRSFPREETFGLTSQIRRAAASIAANIAEGHGRETPGAFVQFLRVAQGSLKELETHVIPSSRVGHMKAPSAAGLLARCDDLGKMVRALIRSLQKSPDGR